MEHMLISPSIWNTLNVKQGRMNHLQCVAQHDWGDERTLSKVGGGLGGRPAGHASVICMAVCN